MTPEQMFIERTKLHISLVEKYMFRLAKEFPNYRDYLLDQFIDHDCSKFREPEKTPYIDITMSYLDKNFIPSLEQKAAMHIATFNHIKNNKHHPEYWDKDLTIECLNSQNRDKPSEKIVNAEAMPDNYILEMVADWMAVSEERGTDPYIWARNNIDIRWKFTTHQQELIYKALSAIWKRWSLEVSILAGDKTYKRVWLNIKENATFEEVKKLLYKGYPDAGPIDKRDIWFAGTNERPFA